MMEVILKFIKEQAKATATISQKAGKRYNTVFVPMTDTTQKAVTERPKKEQW